MAIFGGYNDKPYRGKYGGKAGKNSGRNPSPGAGGPGGGGGKKGCPLFFFQLFFMFSIPAFGIGFIAYKFLNG